MFTLKTKKKQFFGSYVTNDTKKSQKSVKKLRKIQ